MSNRKPYNDRAGYVASRHNLINNGWVVIYRAKEAQLDEDGGKYVVSCELHGTVPKARPFLKIPEFCEDCMEGYIKEAA